MSWFDAVLLGLVQGLTEFLPISSSGHLVITEQILGLHAEGVVVEVALHVATLVAVLVVYRKRLAGLLRGLLKWDDRAVRYSIAIVVATVPAVIVGLTLKDLIESAFNAPTVVGVDLLVTGGILWTTRGLGDENKPVSGIRNPLLIGIAQALAIMPGISRSGSTIAAALWLKMSPEDAAEFSFIMAIPAIAGAAVLQLPDLFSTGFTVPTGPLALGAVTSLISGVAAIVFLVKLLQKRAFHRFAPYCWALGAVVIAWQLAG